MPACTHYQKTLWLDVYNELADTVRDKWQAHLDTCAGCRQEKERMERLVAAMRENLQPPPTAVLSPENLRRLSQSEQVPMFSTSWWRLHLSGYRFRLLPALATFGMVFLVVGIVSYRSLLLPGNPTASHSVDSFEQIVNVDADMIINLDLLKDMETVQQLLHVIDTVEYIQPNHFHRDNTQGKMRHDRRKTYV